MSEEMVEVLWETDEAYPVLIVYRATERDDKAYVLEEKAAVPKELLERFEKAEADYNSAHSELFNFLMKKYR